MAKNKVIEILERIDVEKVTNDGLKKMIIAAKERVKDDEDVPEKLVDNANHYVALVEKTSPAALSSKAVVTRKPKEERPKAAEKKVEPKPDPKKEPEKKAEPKKEPEKKAEVKKPVKVVIKPKAKKEPENEVTIKTKSGKKITLKPAKGVSFANMSLREVQKHWKRPVLPIDKVSYDKIMEMTSKPETDWVIDTDGNKYTFGEVDGGLALMPHTDSKLVGFEKQYKVTPKAKKAEGKKEIEVKVRPSDELSNVRNILEEANYTVISKKVGKTTVKRKAPRQDRTIVKDKVEDVFTTIQKDIPKEKDGKQVEKVTNNLKAIFTKILVAIDKLTTSGNLSQLQKLEAFLKKLVQKEKFEGGGCTD